MVSLKVQSYGTQIIKSYSTVEVRKENKTHCEQANRTKKQWHKWFLHHCTVCVCLVLYSKTGLLLFLSLEKGLFFPLSSFYEATAAFLPASH